LGKTFSVIGVNFMPVSSVALPSFNKTKKSLRIIVASPDFFALSDKVRIFPFDPVKPFGMPPVKSILEVPLPLPSCKAGVSGHNVINELAVDISDASNESPGTWIVPCMALIELFPVFMTRETDIFPSIGQEVVLLINEIEGVAGCADANAEQGKTDKIAVKKIRGIAFKWFFIIVLNFIWMANDCIYIDNCQ